jgi:predicted RNA binding protein YcfA (HicA-like mRNA interferase family)
MSGRQLQRLSARTVATATTPGYIADGGGLYLQVTASGARSWVMRYTLRSRARNGLWLRDAGRPKRANAPPEGLTYQWAVCIIHTMTSADLIKELKTHGFELVSVRGSHHKLRNAANVTVIVPHPKKDLGKGLIAAIRKQAGIE